MVAALLAACTGVGDNQAAAPQLVSTTAEAAGANCASGGVAIHVGADKNGNGTLDPDEVASTTYVCSGSDGTNGTNGTNGQAGVNGTDGTNGQNGSAGSDGANGANGEDQLVRVVSEDPGSNCATGGQAIEIGWDTNGDGILEDDEVQQTSYVCNGGPNPVFHGDMHIRSASDAGQLFGIKHIIGELYIEDGSLTDLDVSLLETVDNGIYIDSFGGSQLTFSAMKTGINVWSYNGSVTAALSFPQLTDATQIYGSFSSVAAPKLASIGFLYLWRTTSDMAFPMLVSASEIDLQNSGGAHAVSLPALTTIDYLYMYGIDVDAPLLTSANQIDLENLANANLPMVSSVDYVELYSTSLQAWPFPSLTATKSLYVQNNSVDFAISLPDATAMQDISIYDNAPALQLPNLTTTNTLNIANTTYQTLSLPALTSIGASVNIYANASLSHLDIPMFQAQNGVRSYTQVYSNPMLSDCEAHMFGDGYWFTNIYDNKGDGCSQNP